MSPPSPPQLELALVSPFEITPADNLSFPRSVQSVWVVPLTVVGRFTKSRDLLRVRQDSLDNLRGHMEAKCRRWAEVTADLVASEPNAGASKTARASWRASSGGLVTPQAVPLSPPMTVKSQAVPATTWSSAKKTTTLSRGGACSASDGVNMPPAVKKWSSMPPRPLRDRQFRPGGSMKSLQPGGHHRQLRLSGCACSSSGVSMPPAAKKSW